MKFRLFSFAAGLLSAFALCFGACQTKDTVDPGLLMGRWTLVQGYIDGQPNQRLKGTYFQFNPDGTMETNLPLGFDGATPFEVEGKQLLQKGAQTFRYEIESVNEDALVLRTELRGAQFKFDLSPAPENEPEKEPQEIISEPEADTLES